MYSTVHGSTLFTVTSELLWIMASKKKKKNVIYTN